MPATQLPVEFLFRLTIDGLGGPQFDFQGPFGRRQFAKGDDGLVCGPKLNGKVLQHMATDYGRASADGTLRQPHGELVIQADDGSVVLAQYRGRSAPRYGAGQSRLQFLFKAAEGPHDGLQQVQAIGFGEDSGERLVVDVYALGAGGPFEGEGNEARGVDRTSVSAEFVLRRRSTYTSTERHIIESPLGTRYLSISELGGAFEGPRIAGEFMPGYSWSPHYFHLKDGDHLLHYDVNTLLRTRDGVPVLMAYTGVTSSRYPKGSWRTAVLFETAQGPHAWLNEIQAVGFGRWMGDGTEYMVYALR